MKTVRFLFIVILLSVISVPLTARAEIRDTVSEEFMVKSGGTLTVDSDLGSIEIRTHGADRVDIEIIRKVKTSSRSEAEEVLDMLDIDMDKRGGDVLIKTTYDRRNRWRRNPLSLEYIITIPETYNVDLKTSGGGISVTDLRGKVKGKTSGGGLRFGNIDGPVYGKTSGGGITIKSSNGDAELITSGGGITMGDVHGDVKATTSGGSIHIDRVYGHVDAHTSGGGIKVEEVKGYINASTSGGTVTANVSGQPDDECRLTTSGGGIHVYLNRDVNMDIDAKTSGGKVSVDFPVTVSGEIKKNQLKARLNNGGPLMYLRTSGGSISLSER